MDKLKMHSQDKVKEHIAQIAALFPNALTETIKDGQVEHAIDFDILKQELSDIVVDGPAERYQVTWPDKKKSILLANAPIAKTLRPCREKSVDFDKTENIYIEGDNLDALKLLQETYLGEIKLIYIDPPYNTTNNFIYEDNFSQSIEEFMPGSGQFDEEGGRLVKNLESNGRFHTDWLNMIYPRLKLSRDLLRDDGVILINIDENEITNLQKICIEIFGSQNDLGTIIWDKRNPKGDAKGISYQHEYILVFCKSIEKFLLTNKVIRPKKNAEKILDKAKLLIQKKSETYSLNEINKEFYKWINSQDFSGGEKAYNQIDENGDVFRPVSMAWPNKKKAPDDYFVPLVHPVTNKACVVPERGWRNPSSTMDALIRAKLIIFGNDETTQPQRKYLLKENMFENIPSLLYYGGSDDNLLKDLGIPFETPKVVEIVAEHISSFTESDQIILDFFAGSSTTAHAVMQINANMNSKRKFIMVQIPEDIDEDSEAYKAGFRTISEIGVERIRKAGEYIKKQPGNFEKNIDLGFRLLKIDSTNMRDIYYSPAQLKQGDLLNQSDNIKQERTTEDLIFQVMLDLGILPSSSIQEVLVDSKKVYNVADGYLLACFDKNVNSETVTEIAKRKPYYAIFRDSSMSDDSVATNFDQIFATYSPTTVRKVL